MYIIHQEKVILTVICYLVILLFFISRICLES